MDFHASLAKLTSHAIFREWHKKHQENFLAHGFMMLDDANKDVWQIGFYNPNNSKITTFIVGKTIEHTAEQEVLESGAAIQKLPVEEVKVEPQKALATAKEILEKDFAREIPIKEFFIIQHIDKRTVFNITYFTQSFKTVNIKLDAGSGELISKNIQALMDFG